MPPSFTILTASFQGDDGRSLRGFGIDRFFLWRLRLVPLHPIRLPKPEVGWSRAARCAPLEQHGIMPLPASSQAISSDDPVFGLRFLHHAPVKRFPHQKSLLACCSRVMSNESPSFYFYPQPLTSTKHYCRDAVVHHKTSTSVPALFIPSPIFSLSFLMLSDTLTFLFLILLSTLSTAWALPSCSDQDTADYDYIVVGAGAGGGPVAARLAEAGFSGEATSNVPSSL